MSTVSAERFKLFFITIVVVAVKTMVTLVDLPTYLALAVHIVELYFATVSFVILYPKCPRVVEDFVIADFSIQAIVSFLFTGHFKECPRPHLEFSIFINVFAVTIEPNPFSIENGWVD